MKVRSGNALVDFRARSQQAKFFLVLDVLSYMRLRRSVVHKQCKSSGISFSISSTMV